MIRTDETPSRTLVEACSFCSKTRGQVPVLIQSAIARGIGICPSCVREAVRVLNQKEST